MPARTDFITWDDAEPGSKEKALAAVGRAYERAMVSVEKTQASARRYRDITAPNTSVREGYDRDDYTFFRPGEAIPTKDDEVVAACMEACERFPIVSNVISLMADFCVKGMDVTHPSPTVQEFGRAWARRVGMQERAERMVSMVLRAAKCVVKRAVGRLPETTLTSLRDTAEAAPKTPVQLAPGEIPLGYTILNPLSIQVVGGELAAFVGPGAFRYAVKVPESLARKIQHPKTAVERELVASLPSEVVSAISSGERSILLEKTRVGVIDYKKDDHDAWARPLVYPLLGSLQLYDKLKMADRAALDGAISHIRLWRIGSLEHQIFPNEAAIEKLASILLNNVGGGSMDLIWGPELDVVETSTEVYKFLGMEKYIPTLEEIYQGLGIPPTLTGSAGASGGFTNNVVSLKTLTERLEYCRRLIAAFWEAELALIQAAFRFRKPFTVTFDQPTFTDESATLKLLLELADRNYISVEYLQERFGAIPEVEQLRIRREERERANGKRPPKAGPWHDDSKHQTGLEKLFAATGAYAPEQFGVELQEAPPGSKPPAETIQDLQPEPAATTETPAGQGNRGKEGGRPDGAGDSGGRKPKKVSPRTKAAEAYSAALLWADQVQRAIADITQPAYLAARQKKNMRALSVQEADDYERFKFALLCQFEPGEVIEQGSIAAKLTGSLAVPTPITQLCRATTEAFAKRESRQPTLDEARKIQANVVALYRAGVDEE